MGRGEGTGVYLGEGREPCLLSMYQGCIYISLVCTYLLLRRDSVLVVAWVLLQVQQSRYKFTIIYRELEFMGLWELGWGLLPSWFRKVFFSFFLFTLCFMKTNIYMYSEYCRGTEAP